MPVGVGILIYKQSRYTVHTFTGCFRNDIIPKANTVLIYNRVVQQVWETAKCTYQQVMSSKLIGAFTFFTLRNFKYISQSNIVQFESLLLKVFLMVILYEYDVLLSIFMLVYTLINSQVIVTLIYSLLYNYCKSTHADLICGPVLHVNNLRPMRNMT